MPLNEQERRGFSEILNFSTADDVISIARTILKDQVQLHDKTEAVSAIISYSLDAKELFRRKKLKKESLFQYLYSKRVDDIIPSAEKNVLVQKILRYWGSDDSYEAMEEDETALNVYTPPTFPQPQLQPETANPDPLNCWLDKSLMPSAIDQEFAVEFCRWFYIMLNESANANNNSSMCGSNQLNASHFFQGCQMHFFVKCPNNFILEKFENADNVAAKLLHLVRIERVTFNPNLDEKGVQTLCDPCGRKVIIVAGTVHQGTVIGLFEQNFGLIRDPASDSSWKIAFTRLAFSLNDSFGPSGPTLEYTRQMLTGF